MNCVEREIALKWCLAFKKQKQECETLLNDLVNTCGYKKIN